MFPALARYLPPNLSDTGRVEALSTDEPLVMQLQGILGLRFVLRHRGAPAKRREACLHRDGSARESRHFGHQLRGAACHGNASAARDEARGRDLD